jgi:hypothetical protein
MFITQQHKQKKLAQLAAQTMGEQTATAGAMPSQNILMIPGVPPSDVIFAALQQDLSALHDISDVAKKIELKRTVLLPKWLPFITQYRDSGAHKPFEPLVRFVIWQLDAEHIAEAIEWADFAIKQQQPMPNGFARTLDSFTAETIHDWAQRQFKAGDSAEPYLSQVIERIESRQWLVNEPIILNKLFKLVGEFAEKDNQPEIAEKYYLKCVEVNPEKHGVKTRLSALQTKLGKPLSLP